MAPKAGQVYHGNLSFFWHVELVTAQEEVEPEILENITTAYRYTMVAIYFFYLHLVYWKDIEWMLYEW